MDFTATAYCDLKMLSEVLTQFVDNDAEPESYREEAGEAEPENVTRARAMLDLVDARLVAIQLAPEA